MATGTIKQTGVVSQACTYDTTYFNTPLYNHYEKCGQFVHVVFFAQIKTSSSTNINVLTGLPPIINSLRQKIIYYVSSTEYLDPPSFGRGGTLVNSGNTAVASLYGATANAYLYTEFTYISAE